MTAKKLMVVGGAVVVVLLIFVVIIFRDRMIAPSGETAPLQMVSDSEKSQSASVNEWETVTYKDQFFDFSLKYPKDWEKPTVPLANPSPELAWHQTSFRLAGKSTGSFVQSYGMEGILVKVETLPQGVATVEQYVQFMDKKNAGSEYATEILETKKLTINGAEAIQRKEKTAVLSEATREGMQFLRTYVKGPSFVMIFRNTPSARLSTGAVSPAAQDIHNQILNTLTVK
jgi:hypothetical protein